MLTDKQKKILDKYGVYSGDDIDLVLDELDAKITAIGFTDDWQHLNSTGDVLQQLYDEIYAQEDDKES